jgi:hypothetical protein
MRVSIPFLTAAAVLISTAAGAQQIDWQKVDDVLGRKPAVTGDVHRYGFPRTDLSVTLDGVAIKPALALGGWVAFKPAHDAAMIMGDLVLLETEINPVMAKLIEGGLDITAVHNHLLRANPATFYMHVGGHGDPVKMATVIHEALSASKTPLSTPAAATPAPSVDLNTAQLDQIIPIDPDQQDRADEPGNQVAEPSPKVDPKDAQNEAGNRRPDDTEHDIHQEPHFTLHELFGQPACNSADDDGCDPACLCVVHGSSPQKAHPCARFRLSNEVPLYSRSIDYLSAGAIGP